ncbi:MAG: single-stranded DNA-binding protein [Candidatus Niyogibacteria bacterium]|nr:single-stranded DNA-binding protein [Candidatus Niyogibacteria bacterium]
MNLNKVMLIGNLTKDPELKTLPSGAAVATFGLATNRTWKDKNGQKQTDAQFHNIVIFGRIAEVAKQYAKKGDSMYIEGRIQTRSWEGKDGVKRYTTEIIAENMQLGGRSGGHGTTASNAGSENHFSQAAAPKEQLDTIEYPADEINPDDIPF